MATSSQLDLAAYMSNSIRTIMAKAYKSVLSNPREAKFAYRMQTHFQKSEKRRKKMLEQEGLEVPPFLISSIVEFINTLTPDMVKQVVCFGSSAIIKSPVPQMRELLQARGITVSEKEFTCRGSMGPIHSGHPNQKDLDDFRQFIKSTL
jgi:hypothetical protein